MSSKPSRMGRQWILVAAVLVTVVHAAAPLPLVSLGSKDVAQACVGVQVSPLHVLVHSTCVKMKGPLTTAQAINLALNATNNTTTQASLEESVAVANSTTIAFELPPGNATASNSSSPVHSVHVLALKKPLTSNFPNPVALPLKTPYPSYLDVDHNATLVSVDVSLLAVTSISDVIYVADEMCDHPVCALPLEVEDRNGQTGLDRWSFVFKHDPIRDAYHLLGVGGDPVTDASGIWGFSWLPQVLKSSSFIDNNVHGVKTVVPIKKEIHGGKDVKTTSEYTEFIAGLRTSQDGETYCGGTLITPKWVLTSAGCKDIHNPTWVVIDTLRTSGKPTEAMKVKRTLKHPNYKTGSHSYNFMMVELEKASSRRPARYSWDKAYKKDTGTAFGYGAVLYQTRHMYDRLRSNKVSVLTDCPKDLKLDKTAMCVQGKISYGDYGGPVMKEAWSKNRILEWVIGNNYKFHTKKDYAVVGHVPVVYHWIGTVINQK
ncbi:hypothetical protein Poli38472_011489 [Pythium oligandrum]|uniref:Peptidase S1 domain-containing protein n=1 Tax=Pythium oligandrum TaxID=41045 RepID=A0A8K1CK94_PYTOL|nr:hypothetical protein Poli38472_011489 [Pythium oligandrum]|eukprot:TMW64609.1 hypothetical protein Poli38472_011489 [Pythium oligandrum]